MAAAPYENTWDFPNFRQPREWFLLRGVAVLELSKKFKIFDRVIEKRRPLGMNKSTGPTQALHVLGPSIHFLRAAFPVKSKIDNREKTLCYVMPYLPHFHFQTVNFRF